MAKIEFFRITIKDKKTNNLLSEIDFSKYLKNKLSNTSDAVRLCTHGTNAKCSASVGEYQSDIDNITFDLIKFQQKYITSTLNSEPKLEVDTFKALHQAIMDNTKYTKENIQEIDEITQNTSLNLFEIKSKLEKKFNTISKFSIYKIIKEENLDREEDGNLLSKLFYDAFLIRLTKEKTFFNIWVDTEKRNILLMERNSSGFTFNHLENYFNKHLLKDDNYKVSIDYIYNKSFRSILEEDNLHKFEFTMKLQEKSLTEENINLEFEKLFLKYFGKTKVTIKINPLDDKKGKLDNTKLINFLEKSIDTGLSSSIRISKQSDKQKNIESTSKGDTLVYRKNIRAVTNLEEAHNLFQVAIKENSKIF